MNVFMRRSAVAMLAIMTVGCAAMQADIDASNDRWLMQYPTEKKALAFVQMEARRLCGGADYKPMTQTYGITTYLSARCQNGNVFMWRTKNMGRLKSAPQGEEYYTVPELVSSTLVPQRN